MLNPVLYLVQHQLSPDINGDESSRNQASPFKTLCETCWLVRLMVVSSLLCKDNTLLSLQKNVVHENKTV